MTNHVRFSEICLSNYGMIFIQVEGASERAVIEILKANNVLTAFRKKSPTSRNVKGVAQ